MIRVPEALRSFQLTLAGLWTVVCIAGLWYAHQQDIPLSYALPLIAAFLWEASFYVVPGFESVRKRLEERWPPPALALWLVLSALAPYLTYSLPTGFFRWSALVMLAAMAFAVSFWYVLLPRTAVFDVLFVALMAAVVLAKGFTWIYVSPVYGVRIEILGQLMWIRLGVMVVLSLRRVEGVGFGFLPSQKDWTIGLKHSLYFLPIGLPLAVATGLLRFQPLQQEWWKVPIVAAGTFLGMLWVVALSEEFFFRGLLQQWLSRWLSSGTAGLIVASILFGLVHLPFRSFPNWKFALVAALAGIFYGRAYARSGSIRAAMVSHAVVNTAARMFFA